MIKLVKKFNEKNVQTIEAYVCACACVCRSPACDASPIAKDTLGQSTSYSGYMPSKVYNPAPFVTIC